VRVLGPQGKKRGKIAHRGERRKQWESENRRNNKVTGKNKRVAGKGKSKAKRGLEI